MSNRKKIVISIVQHEDRNDIASDLKGFAEKQSVSEVANTLDVMSQAIGVLFSQTLGLAVSWGVDRDKAADIIRDSMNSVIKEGKKHEN